MTNTIYMQLLYTQIPGIEISKFYVKCLKYIAIYKNKSLSDVYILKF